MPYKEVKSDNLQRETLRKIMHNHKLSPNIRELAQLRLAYSEDHKLLTGAINKLVGVNRLYLHHLPTQTSGRWSTWITNWPRACVNQHCPRDEHEWTEECWSVRDILIAEDNEIKIEWDHDNIEGKIHDLIVNDEQAIKAHQEGHDLHTITCCNIFDMPYPINLKNPHTSTEDAEWRHLWDAKYGGWQGKDTKVRVLSKNFNHGSKYTESYKFVSRISGIEKYGVTYKQLEELARKYIASKGEAWQRKLDIMKKIRSERIARSLYGFRRVFFDSSADTGREGFSHMISGTVSDYNNETIRLMEEWLGEDNVLLHNAHDGDKYGVTVKRWNGECADAMMQKLRSIVERPIEYEGRSLVMTAGVKVHV